MEQLRKKIKEEYYELAEKTIKLQAFMLSNEFNQIKDKQKELLRKQLKAMSEYKNILLARLKED